MGDTVLEPALLIIGQAGNDTLRDELGDATLSGGGADSFAFNQGDDMNVITDFKVGQNDRLVLSSADTGGLDGQDVLENFGTSIDGKAALDFGGEDLIVFGSLTDLTRLESQIDIF